MVRLLLLIWLAFLDQALVFILKTRKMEGVIVMRQIDGIKKPETF